ncbi:fucolectin-like, partial [Ictalurus furcatus]|uniref:fucolectin-like n=1 Tax=Ictalurus furcatus TaxID=66913 RepID=UPI002350C55B
VLFSPTVNVALGGIATQSSVYNYYPAYFAIDGNRESNAYLLSCTHTNYEYKPWWRVDLLAVYDISNVIVTNRGDSSPQRIDGAEIRIGNSLVNNGNNNPRCVVISSIPAGASANYTCKMSGRYVNIIIPNVSQILTLCEVEVYGVAGYTFIFSSQFHIKFKVKLNFITAAKYQHCYFLLVPVTKRAFLRLKFNSIEDLMNPTVRDKVLQKMISVNVQPSVYQIRWTKQPEQKTGI